MDIGIDGGNVLAVDPGRSKTGLAVLELSDNGIKALWREIVPTDSAVHASIKLSKQYKPVCVVIGDKTSSSELRHVLGVLDLPIYTIDEHLSSAEARRRYFELYPPKGLKRLIPVTMQTPPVPVDDLVAVILGERFAKLIRAQPSGWL